MNGYDNNHDTGGYEKRALDEDNFGAKGGIVQAFDAFRMAQSLSNILDSCEKSRKLIEISSQIEASVHHANIGRRKMDRCYDCLLTRFRLG